MQEILDHPWVNKGFHSAPIYTKPPRALIKSKQDIDVSILVELSKIGFDESKVISDLIADKESDQSVVLYNLFYNHKSD